MTIDIEDIKRISLAPGELLAVQVDVILSAEMQGRIIAAFDQYPALRGRVIVFDRSIRLSVVAAETGA